MQPVLEGGCEMIRECPYGCYTTVEVCGSVCECGLMCERGLLKNCPWAFTHQQKPVKEAVFEMYLKQEYREDEL
jgi:hypothetical protein